MRRLIIPILYIAVQFLTACAGNETAPPSSNTALESISPDGNDKQKKGYMQRHYDQWVTEEWEPATAGRTAADTDSPTPETSGDTVKRDHLQKGDTDGTLQKYVDKWSFYLETQEKEHNRTPSHVRELETLPAIGTPGR